MATHVVRRFEIRLRSEDSVAGVKRKVTDAVAMPAPVVRSEINAVPRPPVLEVRLEGSAAAVAAAMARIAKAVEKEHGARIQHDVLRARNETINPGGAGARALGQARNGSPYPDPSARMRVGAEALPPAKNNAPVTVALVDSGLMLDHPAFKDHLWMGAGVHGKQFIEGKDDDRDINDQDGHGTSQAGTVIAGAADAPVKLMIAKFIDAANPARPDNAAAALTFAVANGAQIILLAWDVGLGSPALEKAFGEACDRALVVIAAGNYGSDNDWYDGRTTARVPVRYAQAYRSTTITVMATDELDDKAWFSNYGRTTVDLAAPGSNVISTRRALSNGTYDTPRKYRSHSGTSPAAAYVAGAAALLMSRYPGLSREHIKGCLLDSVDKLPGLKCVSGGRLNIGAALRCAAETPTKP